MGSGSGGMGTGGMGSGGAGVSSPVTIYVAGDSTVSTYEDTASLDDQAGWGQMLPAFFDDGVVVDNRARGGRTARWFHLEGGVAGILEEVRPGDYFFIQFGTNDSNSTATFEVDGVTYPRYANAQTDFKVHLKDYYLDPTRAVAAIPVLVTPPPRNSAYCGTGNSLGAYAEAMRELGAAEGVAVLDLNQKTFDHLAGLCPAPTPENFFLVRTDGTVDGTHFQENGARLMASFLVDAIEELGLGLASHLLR
jgi:lysophospholipase L1-like esterase